MAPKRCNVDPKLCFVLAPMKGPFKMYFRDVIRPAATAAGLDAQPADEIFGSRPIMRDIWDTIWKARIVIADVTNKNPNVNYELGICHALGVPTVLITENIDDVPFDYRDLRCLVYDTRQPRWQRDMRDRIKKTIEAVLTQPEPEDRLPWPPQEPEFGDHPFLRRFYEHVSKWKLLNARCTKNPDLKRAIAKFLLERYLAVLARANVSRWFLDSGSSVAFLSEVFADELNQRRAPSPAHLRIETNNILSYLEFIFVEIARVGLYPPGRPEGKYGSTFGPLEALPIPTTSMIMTDPARRIVDEIRAHFVRVYTGHGLVFAATSGFDLGCGPHVGSYPSMLFKRAFFESKCPIILLLDEDKLRVRLQSNCFAVCDDVFKWKDMCRTLPIALGIVRK